MTMATRVMAGLVSWSLVASWGGAAESQPPKDPEPFRYHAAGRRDPFAALVRDGKRVTPGLGPVVTEPSAKPVLYGILWDPGGDSIALVNELEVRVGDPVGPYRVREIRQDAVVLVNGGESLVLQLEFELFGASPRSSGATMGGEPQ